jgi:hypothetical protein
MRSLARPDAASVVADEVCKFLFSAQVPSAEERSTQAQ